MKITNTIELLFKRYLPSPFTIAILLTFFTFILAFLWYTPQTGNSSLRNIFSFWVHGIWNTALLEFAYQMMLILVLGHVLVLSKPVNYVISKLVKYAKNTSSAVILVSISTMLAAFFNWGLGLIFGALLARKVGEHAQQNKLKINYPLVGAAGYVGLMVWHGGISGSAPIKVAEKGHIVSLMQEVTSPNILSKLPDNIHFGLTVFSWQNLLLFGILLVLIPLVLHKIAKSTKPKIVQLPIYSFQNKKEENLKGAEKLDDANWLGISFGMLILLAFVYQYGKQLLILQITPNMLNFLMLGLAILLHKNFNSFLSALQEAIQGTAGILIQFPLYFGIMGILKGTGIITMLSGFFTSIATSTSLPIFTFFSAGLVNILVPSGGGQWVIQGPIILESAIQLGVPLQKVIMALAYGDQITNMMQPFWALPLLAITKLKAKEILPYTLILMLVGTVVFVLGLWLL